MNYVQISLDSYRHLSGLEDHVTALEPQVTTLESQVKDLNEKLSAAYLEISSKENLVKQHAKVAEEAVSGRIPSTQLSSLSSLYNLSISLYLHPIMQIRAIISTPSVRFADDFLKCSPRLLQ